METIAAGRTEQAPPQQETRANPEKHASSKQSIGKFAEARMAKKSRSARGTEPGCEGRTPMVELQKEESSNRFDASL